MKVLIITCSLISVITFVWLGIFDGGKWKRIQWTSDFARGFICGTLGICIVQSGGELRLLAAVALAISLTQAYALDVFRWVKIPKRDSVLVVTGLTALCLLFSTAMCTS